MPDLKRLQQDAVRKPAPGGFLVYAPDPIIEARQEIRRLLDDKRLNWAIWPADRQA